MPFLRFSRDKRGYANTYLCHTFREDGIVRMRVLYWFRTPPDIAVGRPALDAEAIRDIEASNPGLTFDWGEILKAKPPPTPPDRGREERREGRARRREHGASIAGGAASAGSAGADGRPPARARAAASPDGAATGSEPGAGEPPAARDETAAGAGARPRRRRRRRRRRGGGGDEPRVPGAASAGAEETPTEVEPDSDPA